MTERKTVVAEFEMSFWHRLRIASCMWWDIVITGELECLDDRSEDEILQDLADEGNV